MSLSLPGSVAPSTATTPSGRRPPQGYELSSTYQPPKKKKRVKHDVVFSQPTDQGIGQHSNTKFFFILDTLKKRNGPMSLNELSIMTDSILETDPEMLARFEAHEKVMKNPVNGLYSYRLEHEIVSSRADLIKEIKSHSRRGGGLSVRTLKETWSAAPTHIEELEAEGLVLVTRAVKDGQPKMVFWNDIPPAEGGKKIEDEFLTMWDTLKWPVEADMQRALAQHDQTPSRTTALPLKVVGPKKKGRKAANRSRQTKIQNTHLNIDLTKDYVPPPPTAS